MTPRRLIAALVTLTLAAPASAGTRTWTLDDLLDVRVVTDPQVHADALSVVYVVQDWNAAHTDFQTDLWVSKVNGSESRQITFADQNDDTPRWAPTGRWLAFISERPRPGKSDDPADEGRRQVWRMRTDGGESQCVTDLPGGANAFEWTRDGSTLVVLSTDPKSAEQKQRDQDRDDAWRPEERLGRDRLWVVDVETRKATALTTDLHVTGFSVSPDGKQVVFAAQPTSRVPDAFRSDLYLVPLAGGTPTPLVTRPGIDLAPAWSPDGRWIAFLSQQPDSTEWYSNDDVCIVAPTGGAVTRLTAGLDAQISSSASTLRWNHDGSAVAFVCDRGTTRPVMFAYVDGRPPEAVTSGDYVCGTPTIDGNSVVALFTRESSTEPREVYFQRIGGADPRRAAGGEPRRVTDLNPQAREFLAFRKERITWKGPDGLALEGLLIYPAGYQPGQRAPLLTVVHGGPAYAHSQTATVQQLVYPYALLAQHGWALLLPNPRGSGGYGSSFRAANVRDWGGKDHLDILAGIDALIERGLVDANRLAVCGWSYGGYLTATLVTKSDRFKAAVVGAGVTDVASTSLTSDIPEFSRSYFGGWPWDDAPLYIERSPVFQAGRVKTPTALIHGAGDVRVPLGQAWEFYNALRLRNVPTDLLVLPRSGHLPREPKLLKAAMQWHLDWLERWTLGVTAAGKKPEAKPAPARPAAGRKP